MNARVALKQVAQWSAEKAGGRRELIEELRRRAPGARGFNDESQVSRWQSGTVYSAEALVAMVGYLTDMSVDELIAALHDHARFQVRQPAADADLEVVRETAAAATQQRGQRRRGRSSLRRASDS